MIRFFAKRFNYKTDPEAWGIYAEGSCRKTMEAGYSDFEDWIHDESDIGVVAANNICVYLNTLNWDHMGDVDWDLIETMIASLDKSKT